LACWNLDVGILGEVRDDLTQPDNGFGDDHIRRSVREGDGWICGVGRSRLMVLESFMAMPF